MHVHVSFRVLSGRCVVLTNLGHSACEESWCAWPLLMPHLGIKCLKRCCCQLAREATSLHAFCRSNACRSTWLCHRQCHTQGNCALLTARVRAHTLNTLSSRVDRAATHASPMSQSRQRPRKRVCYLWTWSSDSPLEGFPLLGFVSCYNVWSTTSRLLLAKRRCSNLRQSEWARIMRFRHNV